MAVGISKLFLSLLINDKDPIRIITCISKCTDLLQLVGFQVGGIGGIKMLKIISN